MAGRYGYSSSSSSDYSSPIDISGLRFTPALHRELISRISKDEISAYEEQVNASEGFDVYRFPNAKFYGPIVPIRDFDDRLLQQVTELAKIALDNYNLYAQDDVKYEFLDVVMVNSEHMAGVRYYITFAVRPTSNPAADPKTFQATVRLGANFYAFVELCRPKPPPGYVPRRLQHNELSDEDADLYSQMAGDSGGFDMPDIPNSSGVPGLIRPMKSLDGDSLQLLENLSKIALDRYNKRNHSSCEFRKVVKANKQEEDDIQITYFITFLVKNKDQFFQANVTCQAGQEPFVTCCRTKPTPDEIKAHQKMLSRIARRSRRPRRPYHG